MYLNLIIGPKEFSEESRKASLVDISRLQSLFGHAVVQAPITVIEGNLNDFTKLCPQVFFFILKIRRLLPNE